MDIRWIKNKVLNITRFFFLLSHIFDIFNIYLIFFFDIDFIYIYISFSLVLIYIINK